jgi:hypothetical protein
MSNEIVKSGGQPFKVGIKKVGLAAKIEQAAKNNPDRIEITTPPNEMQNRIGIVFDDSGSMVGTSIKDAHKGCEEFLRSCDPKTTAIACYPMNTKNSNENGNLEIKLSVNLMMISTLINKYRALGGTPLYETTKKIMENEPINRAIVFSDGQPNYGDVTENDVVTIALEKKIPIDTVYIGYSDNETLQKLAERTGGIYLHFDSNKSNFRTAFKYLSPGYRAMLADKSFVDKLQKGEV